MDEIPVIVRIFNFLGYKAKIASNEMEDGYTFFVYNENVFLASFTIAKEVCELKEIEERLSEDLITLFHNNIWPANQLNTKNDLVDFINNNFPDRSPGAKIERVLLLIYSYSEFDGQQIYWLNVVMEEMHIWRKAFLNGGDELNYYINYLVENNFLDCDEMNKGDQRKEMFWIAVKGLEKIVTVQEKNISKTCFVAMSFNESLKEIYTNAIFPAIEESGFKALKIDDDVNISSETTINDAMLAAIKKSKFTIADFTQHRSGVYFEAGYALGRGQKVIYTCRKDEIDKAHFDTRNYPHIVWENAADLKKQLMDKIEVFIKG